MEGGSKIFQVQNSLKLRELTAVEYCPGVLPRE